MQLFYIPILFIFLNIFVSTPIRAQLSQEYSSDYNFKWKKYKSEEYGFKCKLPLEHDIRESEHEFGKEIQISSEHEFLSFFISALKHKSELESEDLEDLCISATYSFINAMDGDLVYMRPTNISGVAGYESRIKVKDEMQARYAVFIKDKTQYQVVMVFLSNESEPYFQKVLKGLKFK